MSFERFWGRRSGVWSASCAVHRKQVGTPGEFFSSDDAYRALDSVGRLLAAVSAPQSEELEKRKLELLRVRFDEQTRGERRKQAGTAIESAAAASLKPWREIVTPHRDVASGAVPTSRSSPPISGRCIWVKAQTSIENPSSFFRRTYLTESLKGLLVGAIRRLAGRGGDPVVQLQTKLRRRAKTHSMLALYHLFSGTASGKLDGIDSVLEEAEATELAEARRVVLVGNKISPGNPVHQAGWHGLSEHFGASWRGNWVARRAFRTRRKPTTKRRRVQATHCGNSSMNMGPLPDPHR